MLLGLAVELAAVAKILSSVEAGKEQVAKSRAWAQRTRRKLPKWFPGAIRTRGPQRRTIGHAGEANIAASVQVASSGLKLGETPQSFEEVGERLNEISEALYTSEQEREEQTEAMKRLLEDRIGRVSSDVSRG